MRRKKSQKISERIIIDAENSLVFNNEEELFEHFSPQIQLFEDEFKSLRSEEDISQDDFEKFEFLLTKVLEDPDEIWEDSDSISNMTIYHFLGKYSHNQKNVFYIAVTYVVDEKPVFVFLHFPTENEILVNHYRRGEMIYDRTIKEVEMGAVEGDALSEGDPLAVGLYKAMLKVRSDRDIEESVFSDYIYLREKTIEEADEIWRSTDYQGHVLVTFFKDFSDEDHPDLNYIVVTIEDQPSNSHVLLFSFPTKDKHLVDRYRHGENLQADEVVQESSH